MLPASAYPINFPLVRPETALLVYQPNGQWNIKKNDLLNIKTYQTPHSVTSLIFTFVASLPCSTCASSLTVIPLLGIDGDVANDDLLTLPPGVGRVNLFWHKNLESVLMG